MTPLAEVAERIRAKPAPVLIVDTCNFLDLFRVARPTKDAAERRVELAELLAAVELLKLLGSPDPPLYHVVPELVPGEFKDNATEKVEEPFRLWLDAHDKNQQWLSGAGYAVGLALPTPVPVQPFHLSGRLRQLAEALLATATVLARDQTCLDRAVSRLIGTRRPSHKKEMKDSMNLEQSLELARRLRSDGTFGEAVAFISSNTNDYADSGKARVHPDLRAEFDAVRLDYHTSFASARGLYDRGARDGSGSAPRKGEIP